MNLHQQALMGKPSVIREFCAICGMPAQSKHHIVPRSQGGADGPVISLCGYGNESGCHGQFHAHKLHLRWNDQVGWWECLYTARPKKYEQALHMDGWKRLRRH